MMKTSTRLLAALAASAMLATPMPAVATVVTGNTTNLSFETIDPNQNARVTIHKTRPFPSSDEPREPLVPNTISNVTFTIKRVEGIDLTTQQGWDTVAELEVDDVSGGPFDLEFSAVTDAEGDAVFPSVPVGVYLVVETPPANPSSQYREGEPFLFTVPLGSAEGTFWNYDIKVNAKHKQVTPPTSTPVVPPIIPPIIPPGPPVTPPTATTTVTSPVAPDAPTEPTVPGQPSRPSLARTGAAVIQIVIVGSLLLAAGVFLVSRRRKEQ